MERIRIAQISQDDTEIMKSIYNMNDNYMWMEKETSYESFSKTAKSKIMYALYNDDNLAGLISIGTISYDISIIVGKEFRGKGIASTALKHIMYFYFKHTEYLKAMILDCNFDSINLFKKNGFFELFKTPFNRDATIYACSRRSFSKKFTPTINIEEIASV